MSHLLNLSETYWLSLQSRYDHTDEIAPDPHD